MFLILVLLCIFISFCHCLEDFQLIGPIKHIGFGRQRMERNAKLLRKRLDESAAPGCGSSEEYLYTDAVVDNFAPIEKQQKWFGGQRYWINNSTWGGAGFPIFVYIGGEGPESCRSLSNRLNIFNLAEQHQGLMVDVEHRYYGLSFPTSDVSTENLQYLTSQQALADLARIIGYVKSKLNTESSKVITLGGSYPGNMAAWFRLKYPSVSQGSVASSAPLIAKTNFYEYMEVVGNSLKYFSGQQCFDAFNKAAFQVAAYAEQGYGSPGMKKLEKDFNTCSTINNDLDLGIFYSDVMGNVQGVVQYNMESSTAWNVTDICSTMLSTDDSYGAFVKLSNNFLSYYGLSCEDASWNDVVDYISSTAHDATNNYRTWLYQTCNEFGYYQTSDSLNQPFYPFKQISGLTFSREMCAAAFDGWKSDPDTDFINQSYGDIHIAGTNIVFPSGTIDPWHILGVTNDTASLLPQTSEVPIYILGTAHCDDMYYPSSNDSPEMAFAKTVIADNVAKWLN